MSYRRWRVRTVPLSQISKQEMITSIVIMAIFGTLFAVMLFAHSTTSGISCAIGVWTAILLRWLAWAIKH